MLNPGTVITFCVTVAVGLAAAVGNGKPEIGAYQMNFKYDKVKVISEVANSKVTLPLLKSSYYTDTTYQLVCKADYPIQWVYSGFGSPQVRAITTRLSSNELGDDFSRIFEAKVIFSFTEASQFGRYFCQSLASPELLVYFDISVAGEEGIYVTHSQANGQTQVQDLLLSPRGKKTFVCCSNESSEFPSLSYEKCESVSDCGIRLSYMENRPKCNKTRSCRRSSLMTKQKIENGKKCSTYDSLTEIGGLVQCSGASAKNEYVMFTTLESDKELSTDFETVPPNQDVLNLFVEPVGTGEIFISCAPNWFFFSKGIRWGVQNQTGKIKFLNDDRSSIRVKKDDFIGQTVFCFAPLWNSVDWRNVSAIIKS